MRSPGVRPAPEVVRQLHDDLAWTVVAVNGVAAGWALGAHWVAALRRRSLWLVVIVAEVSLFVQAGLGTAILSDEDIEAPDFHLLYGFTAVASVGIIYSYRQQLGDRRYLLYGLGGLWLTGLCLRAMSLRT